MGPSADARAVAAWENAFGKVPNIQISCVLIVLPEFIKRFIT